MFLLLLALFLFPIAVYCTILGMINRRPQPLAVSGAWDFLGVLLATSGFLLFVGPALLSGAFRQSLRDLPIQYESGALESALGEIWAAWWVLWLLYYLFVLGGAAFLVWTQRDTTVIYNIDPQTLEAALARAAQRLGLEVGRRGNRLYIGVVTPTCPSETPAAAEAGVSPPPPEALPPIPSAGPTVVVDVEPFLLLNNVSLHWRSGGSEARADLKRELHKALAEVFTVDSAVGGWLLAIGAFLFILIMLLTGIFVAMVVAMARAY